MAATAEELKVSLGFHGDEAGVSAGVELATDEGGTKQRFFFTGSSSKCAPKMSINRSSSNLKSSPSPRCRASV
jgi:hypothetical protein